MGAGTSIDGPTCDATKHRSRNGSRVGPGNCTNGERTSKTEPFEFDCLAARFLQSGLLAVDPHHVVVPIAGVGVPRTAKRIAGGDRTGPSGRQRIRPPALLRVRLRPRHAALVSHLCSRCHRDHGRAKTLRMTLAPSSRKRLAVPDVPFSRNLSPSTLDEAQQAVNVRRLCQAGADVSHTFSLPASRSPKRHAVFVAPSAVRKRERSALSGLAPGEPFPLRIPSCNSSSGG